MSSGSNGRTAAWTAVMVVILNGLTVMAFRVLWWIMPFRSVNGVLRPPGSSLGIMDDVVLVDWLRDHTSSINLSNGRVRLVK